MPRFSLKSAWLAVLLALGCVQAKPSSKPADSDKASTSTPPPITPPAPGPNEKAPPKPATTPRFEDLYIGDAIANMTAVEWIDAYANDRTKADAEYKGKLVRIGIKVQEIDKADGKVKIRATTRAAVIGSKDPPNFVVIPLEANDPILEQVKVGKEIEALGYLAGRTDDGKVRGKTDAEKAKYGFYLTIEKCRLRLLTDWAAPSK